MAKKVKESIPEQGSLKVQGTTILAIKTYCATNGFKMNDWADKVLREKLTKLGIINAEKVMP